MNQALKLFVRQFEDYYQKQTGENVTFAIDHQLKRPDFTLVHMGQRLHIVEIKATGHIFGNEDWNRLHNYLRAFEDFFKKHEQLSREFPNGWIVNLVCDSVKITDPDKNMSYENWKEFRHKIDLVSWNGFLMRAITANEKFLNAQDRAREEETRLSDESTNP